jgi:hypothetical protein
MRNCIVVVILLLIISATSSIAADVKPKDKVILTVNAIVNASAKRPGIDNVGDTNDEFTCQLTETVEYKIVSKTGERMGLEMLSHKNRMTINGKGSSIVHAEGLNDNRDDWTYKIDPESVSPQASIARISTGPPYKVEIDVKNFYMGGNGNASGTSQNFARFEGENFDIPVYETTPITKVNMYANTAAECVFVSPEDRQLSTPFELTALQKKLQAPYKPREDGGFFTSGSTSHSYKKTDETNTTYNGSINVSWSVQCGEGPERVNAVIIPKGDYKSWLPAAGTSAGNPGNTISFDVELRNSVTDAKAKEKTAQFEYELIDTSNEPGSCGNSPWNDRKHDIQILKTDNPSFESIEKDGQSAKSKKKLKQSSITLSCFDGGAYTKLKVTAHIDGENDVVADVVVANLTNTGLQEVSLPFDENGNHIADAWETKNNVKGNPTNEDQEDIPQGNRKNGDGLTIWEEYRGFLEDGNHIRTDPRKKDFFICDTIGGRTKAGIDRFAALSKLKVHSRLRLDELSQSRVINRNHSPDAPHVVDQHGIRMDAWSKDGVCRAQGGPGTPGSITAVLIDTNWSTLEWIFHKGANTMYASFIPTIAHELLHCCNVWHHGEGDPKVWWHSETVGATKRVYEFASKEDCGHPDRGAPIRVMDEEGTLLAMPTARKIWLGQKQGQHSGCEDCVMRYSASDAYPGVFDVRWCFLYDEPEIIGQNICIDRDGTGVNAPDRKPQPRYGDASADRGACIDKICVNDLYQGAK